MFLIDYLVTGVILIALTLPWLALIWDGLASWVYHCSDGLWDGRLADKVTVPTYFYGGRFITEEEIGVSRTILHERTRGPDKEVLDDSCRILSWILCGFSLCLSFVFCYIGKGLYGPLPLEELLLWGVYVSCEVLLSYVIVIGGVVYGLSKAISYAAKFKRVADKVIATTEDKADES